MKNVLTLLVAGLACALLAVVLHSTGMPHDQLVMTAGETLTAMAVVQSTYSDNIAAAVDGMIADMTTSDCDTRICETVAGIAFGVAVGQGTADKGATVGGATAAKFVGISVRDITLVNATVDKYARYQNMAVMSRGDIWVTVGGDVVAGGDVTFVASTGVLSSAGADGTHFAIAGARWMTSALSGGRAVVRLSGSLPSA